MRVWNILNLIFFLPSIFITFIMIMIEVVTYYKKNKETNLNELHFLYQERVDIYTSRKHYPVFEFTSSILTWAILFNFISR